MDRNLNNTYNTTVGIGKKRTTATNDVGRILPHGFWEWLLVPFIIGLMTLSNIEGWSKIMVLYGFIFAFLFLIYFSRHRLKLQPEVVIYFIWIIWSLTGMSVNIDPSAYWEGLSTIIQMGVLIFLVAGISALRQNIATPILGIAIGGIIVVLSGLYTGEFQEAYQIEFVAVRVAGVTKNPNAFAYHLLFVIFAMFYIWGIKPSLWKRIFLSAVIALTTIGIIYSESRKGFLAVLAFMLLWWLFCYGKQLFKKPIRIFIILVILSGGIYYVTDYVISSTYLGKRFSYAQKYGIPSRVELYQEGFDIIRKEPIFGVGLNNFKVLSSQELYSHSDYIEVAANTGIVGFILYFSIYIMLWRRLNRIQTITDDPHLLYVIGLLKAVIITILLVALGRPNIQSKLTWFFLASAIGYTWSIERTLLSKLLLQRREDLRR